MFVEALVHGECVRNDYGLFAWVVMSNHVHMVLEPHRSLSETMRWLKTATAVRANRLLGRTGQAFWQREYFDRWIRNKSQFDHVVAYVEANPVKAGLVQRPEDWPWSSAWKNTGDGIAGGPLNTGDEIAGVT